MKLTQRQLRRIIREEVRRIAEAQESNLSDSTQAVADLLHRFGGTGSDALPVMKGLFNAAFNPSESRSFNWIEGLLDNLYDLPDDEIRHADDIISSFWVAVKDFIAKNHDPKVIQAEKEAQAKMLGFKVRSRMSNS